MTEQEIAWATGLFEGEGSISIVAKRSLTIVLSSTDLDVVEKFARIVGKGRIIGPKQRGSNKPFWCWQACGDNAVAVLNLMLPMLGERRSAKANEALSHRAPVEKACRCCGSRFTEKFLIGQARVWCSNACRCKGYRQKKSASCV